MFTNTAKKTKFLSTPSARRATRRSSPRPSKASRFLSTPSARRATRRLFCAVDGSLISIHALREEGDAVRAAATALAHNFYPRPPRGGRHTTYDCICKEILFLSTPSARRATSGILKKRPRSEYFYPRPPRGGRPLLVGIPPTVRIISIHALREEGDEPRPEP